MDFRQILKAFTTVRHQLNRIEEKQDKMANKNEAVNELAEVKRFPFRISNNSVTFQMQIFAGV